MKHHRPPEPVHRQKRHIRRLVDHLREEYDAVEIVVTQPKHYRVSWAMTHGGVRHEIIASTTPRNEDVEVMHGKHAIRRKLDRLVIT